MLTIDVRQGFKALLKPCRTSLIKFICKNSYGLKAVNYYWKKNSSGMLDWVLNTPLIFKLLREKLVSCKNNLQLNHSSTGNYLLCDSHMSFLKVTFFTHFFFLESLNQNSLQCHLYYNIKFFHGSCISTGIINKVT